MRGSMTIARLLCHMAMISPFCAAGAYGQAPDDALVTRSGRPVLQTDGRVIGSAYCDTYTWQGRMHVRNRQFVRAGVDLFVLAVHAPPESDDFFATAFWHGRDTFGDESEYEHEKTLDAQARSILDANPDARFLVRWMPAVTKAWAAAHPDQMPKGALIKGDEGRASVRASLASDAALDALAREARGIVEYSEAAAWGDRVIGYAILPPGEGLTRHAVQGQLFDRSPAMQRAFRAWLRDAYPDDDALQQAWHDGDATLDAVQVPTLAEWRDARDGWMHWPDPAATRRYRDYFACVRDLFFKRVRTFTTTVQQAASRPVVIAYDGLKQPMMGWMLRDAFRARGVGADAASVHLGSGSIDVGRLMDHPPLDALMTPADYTARSVGFGFEPEGLGDSMVLRGKTTFPEDDARSWASSPGRVTQGAWRNVGEARAGLLRNTAVSLSRGMFNYWMNVGKGFFDDEQVMSLIAEQVPMRRRLMQQPLAHSEHAIAMIIDDTSPIWEDYTSGFQHLAVLRQRVNQLAQTGLPYRVYLLSDLKREDFPRFRAYLFPNLFELNDRRIELIRDKVISHGSIAIFGPGTGIINDGERGAEAASELLGMPLELKMKEVARYVQVYGGAHPALGDLDGPMTFGDSYIYGPVIQPKRELGAAVELGKGSTWWRSNRAGLVLREFGKGAAGNDKPGERGADDGAVVFSVATPIPSRVLRSLALYGGCVPWSAAGDVVAANANMLAVHSTRAGARQIRLPRQATVTDARTSETLVQDASTFELTLEQAPATRLLTLSPIVKPAPAKSASR